MQPYRRPLAGGRRAVSPKRTLNLTLLSLPHEPYQARGLDAAGQVTNPKDLLIMALEPREISDFLEISDFTARQRTPI